MQNLASPPALVPEAHKQKGIYYAVTDEGVELPVIDVGHPAFAVSLDDQEQRAKIHAFLHESPPLTRLPPLVRRPLLKFLLRGSVLGRAIGAAGTSFLGGMNTYLLKLGPDNLGSGYAKPIDRKIAASLPAFAMRLRLQDMARLLVEAARSALIHSSAGRPLYLMNIAGGSAIDSLNALILLRREDPALLDGRQVQVVVLDLDSAGPHFGARALSALKAPGAPLAGVEVRFRHVHYRWSDATDLVPLLEEVRSAGALVLVSSEGGLFEYGTDEEIVANLRTLRPELAPDGAFVGSVTRADEPMQKLRSSSRVPTRPRGYATFEKLAELGGFQLGRVIERPFSDHVTLRPR